MIDYDKLKKAHEIMQQNNRYYCTYEFGWSDRVMFQLFNELNHICIYQGFNIDDLITKLESLVQPEPKYKIDQEVWAYTHGVMKTASVLQIYWDSDLNDYRLSLLAERGKISIGQSQVYATKSQLIEAQIEYWQSLREPFSMEDEIIKEVAMQQMSAECQHESDHDQMIATDHFILHKCTKCGEFYRG